MQRLAVAFVLVAVGGLGRSEDAHEHGVGCLNVVLEGRKLHIELISPGANLVGFERRARGAKDKRAVEEAIVMLQRAKSLFALPAAAGCKLVDTEVATELLEGAYDSHEAEEHNDDEEAHAGHEEGDHGEHYEDSHSEFHAEYRFSCTEPDAIDRISVKVFAQFPATEERDAQMIAPGGPTAPELTPSNPVLVL